MIQSCDVSIHRDVYLGLSPILYPFDSPTHSLMIIGTKLKDDYHSDANEYISLHFQWALE